MIPINTELFSTLDLNSVNNIISWVPLSVQAKISKVLYHKLAPISINKIINSMSYHRTRMSNAFIDEKNVSDQFIRAHYILHYPHEYRYDYCIRAMKNMRITDFNLDNVDRKKMFKQTINQLTGNAICSIGW